ncbi:MAG: alcohol dehydrogenase catalytic domain-containing protein, partial [Thermoplasmata archaeon]
MQALVVTPPAVGVQLLDMPEPERSAGSVLVGVLECGICGTDRDIVAGRYGTPPAGESRLILGHENLGQVLEVGPEVTGFSAGDLVVATVRRGCGGCRFCLSG